MEMFKVSWHDDSSRLYENFFHTKAQAEKFVETVKPYSWWPDMIEIDEVIISYANTSTTDYDDLSDRPWDWDWGRHIWWDGVSDPAHLRKD